MSFKIRIWHFIVFTCLIVFIFKIKLIAGIFTLMISYLFFLFNNFSSATDQLTFNLADHFVSLILIILLPVTIIISRRKPLLQKVLSFNSAVVIILTSFFIFAPVIADANPEFQKDLRVTKLLPPFSSLMIIHMKKNINNSEHFFVLKEKLIKNSFNDKIIFADNVVQGEKLVYYQKEKSFEIEKDQLISEDGKPKIESKTFIMGTDEYGRDVFARLVYGARISLFVGLGAVFITLFLGVVLGFAAGYVGGVTDILLSRITDMLLAFPIIFLIILILALFGNSLFTVIVVLGYSGWMSLFKIVRGEIISIKNKDYFVSAKLAGLSGKSLLLKEIFPVILAPVIVNLVFQYGNVILAESALSYLGLGTGSLYPSWGGMIESGQEYLQQAWWLILFPGLALFITLFTANNFGKEINLFFNPRLKYD